MEKMICKKIFLFVLLLCIAALTACSSRPTNAAYLPHLQKQQAEQSVKNKAAGQSMQGAASKKSLGGNPAEEKARLAAERRTVFLETRKPLNAYTGFIYQELLAPVSNALLENNFVVTADREKADIIVLLDFGSEGIKKISKMICTPHYEDLYYPDYGLGYYSGYDDFYAGSRLVQTGTDCYPKEYSVYPHTLKVSAYANSGSFDLLGAKQWEVELIYQSLNNEYRNSIRELTSRLSRQLRDVTVWNNSVRIEFDNIR